MLRVRQQCNGFAMSLSTSISHHSDNARHHWPSLGKIFVARITASCRSTVEIILTFLAISLPSLNNCHLKSLKNIIKITKQHELKTIVATRQKNNDFAIVSLLHRNKFIACRIAVTSQSHPEYKSTFRKQTNQRV